jgi:hypothetical protein
LGPCIPIEFPLFSLQLLEMVCQLKFEVLVHVFTNSDDKSDHIRILFLFTLLFSPLLLMGLLLSLSDQNYQLHWKVASSYDHYIRWNLASGFEEMLRND